MSVVLPHPFVWQRVGIEPLRDGFFRLAGCSGEILREIHVAMQDELGAEMKPQFAPELRAHGRDAGFLLGFADRGGERGFARGPPCRPAR